MAISQLIGGAQKRCSSKKVRRPSKKTSKKVRRPSKKTSKKVRRSFKKTSKKVRKSSKKTSKKVRKSSKKTSKKTRKPSKKTSKKVSRSSLKGRANHILRRSKKSSTKVLKISKKHKLIGGKTDDKLSKQQMKEIWEKVDIFFPPVMTYIETEIPLEKQINYIRKLFSMFTCFFIYPKKNNEYIGLNWCVLKRQLDHLHNILHHWDNFVLTVKSYNSVTILLQETNLNGKSDWNPYYISSDFGLRDKIILICISLISKRSKPYTPPNPTNIRESFESFSKEVLEKVLDKVPIKGFKQLEKGKEAEYEIEKARLMKEFNKILEDTYYFRDKIKDMQCKDANITHTVYRKGLLTPS